MTAPSANQSLQFALQKEFLKLYAVTFLGFAIIIEAPQAFYIIMNAGIRDLVILLFILLGVILTASGIVGTIHRLQNSRTVE